jgi:hypothetical protein
MPPGGVAGNPGGVAGGFPMPPGGVAGGRPPGGGVLGPGGGAFPPGGVAGNPGGFPMPPGGVAGGRPIGGVVGAAGGGAIGNPGFPGQPGGAIGRPGFPGQPGIPGRPAGATEDDSLHLSMYAIVEVKDARKMRSGRTQIDHKWGSTVLYTVPGQLEITPVKLPTVKERYDAKYKEMMRSGKPREKELEDLAEWALAHGLLGKFADLMEQLGEINPANKAVVAFKKVDADIRRPITKGEATDAYAKQFRRFKKWPRAGHYVLLYDAKEERPDIDSRYRRLEENFKAFFYWFALKGIALQVPDKQLVAILVDDPKHFKELRNTFDLPPQVADGFYARRDNMAIFSATRLDEAYDAINKATKDMWQQGWDPEKLLSADKQDARKAHPPKATSEQVAYAQTIALLLKALKEESEIASVTHEGTRQLLAATGLKPGTVLLPRGVAAPEWIQFGMGSFFETPEGAPWIGTGAPSWLYLVTFDVMQAAEKLDKPEEALKKVVTDRYFDDSIVIHTEHARLITRSGLLKARTMSWALTYYLARKHLDGLIRYYEELQKLPRDLDFDEDVLMGCFGRAFGLMKEGNSGGLLKEGKWEQLDEAKLQELAKDWYQTIKDTPLEIDEARKDAVKAAIDRQKKGGGGGLRVPGPAGKPGTQ